MSTDIWPSYGDGDDCAVNKQLKKKKARKYSYFYNVYNLPTVCSNWECFIKSGDDGKINEETARR